MSEGRLIEFRCENPQHKEKASSPGVGTITVHERKWAYCDAQANEGHDWQPIEGMAVELLMRVKVSPEELAALAGSRNGKAAAPRTNATATAPRTNETATAPRTNATGTASRTNSTAPRRGAPRGQVPGAARDR